MEDKDVATPLSVASRVVKLYRDAIHLMAGTLRMRKTDAITGL